MENKQEAKEGKKNRIVFSSVLILLLIAVIAVLVSMLLRPPVEEEKKTGGGMAYEANVVTDDADSLQDAVDRLVEKAKEGQMSLEMKTEANSEDGRTFTCYLANSVKNNYDMFIALYLDGEQREIHRTGLIPIGGRIEEFTLDEALEPGQYSATIVYNQVEEDRETIHAQVNVGILLNVR